MPETSRSCGVVLIRPARCKGCAFCVEFCPTRVLRLSAGFSEEGLPRARGREAAGVLASQLWRYIFNDQYGFANLLLFGEQVTDYVPWLAYPGVAFCIVVLADVWKTSSFAALLILAGLQVIPDDLYDAARVDGATVWQRFWHITLPLLKPALLLALLFRTMDAFRVFDLVFVMPKAARATPRRSCSSMVTKPCSRKAESGMALPCPWPCS